MWQSWIKSFTEHKWILGVSNHSYGKILFFGIFPDKKKSFLTFQKPKLGKEMIALLPILIKFFITLSGKIVACIVWLKITVEKELSEKSFKS